MKRIDLGALEAFIRSRLAAVEAERDAARAALAGAMATAESLAEERDNAVARSTCFEAEIMNVHLKRAMLVVQRDAAKAGEARAGEALEKILVGGNHLASALTEMFEDRLPPYGTDFNEARRAFAGSDEYDLWVCWAVIMRVRDSLSDPQPALAWLAQQRREAAAEALENVRIGWVSADDYRPGIPEIWRYIADRAAALRAGATGGADA